jgi:hypothetical protein
MRKFIILITLAVSTYATYAQSCTKSCTPSCAEPCTKTCNERCTKTCDKQVCEKERSKTAEAALISSMRSDLQTVIEKASKSSVAFDSQLKEATIEEGTNDEESLLYISRVAASIRSEFLNKVESTKLMASLKDYTPSPYSTKQQMVANLKQEIQLLATQAENL